MRPGGGKQKGAEFERVVCKDLSLWLSKGTREDLFWRSAMSGGRATLGMREGKAHAASAGDVSAIHFLGAKFIEHFYVECKFYKDLQLKNVLFNGPSKLMTFWKDAAFEATVYKKLPLLIAKENHVPILVVLSSEGRDFFNGVDGAMTAHLPTHDAFIYDYNLFLQQAPHKCLYSRLTST